LPSVFIKQDKSPILRVVNLKKYFQMKGGILGNKVLGHIRAVDEISLTINRGYTTALVGESGSGKTTFGKTILRIYKPDSGTIFFDGREITILKERELKEIRSNMQMVYQDPKAALNPRRNIKSSVELPMVVHKAHAGRKRMERLQELMELVGLSEGYLYRYPPSLSGGEAQRVVIARALALHPKLIVLDEPTASLDVSVQAKILKLLKDLQQKLQLTYLLITHDLSIVRNFSDQINVMYLGKIFERCATIEIFRRPLHPYTKVLLSSIPVISEDEYSMLPKRILLKEELPSPTKLPPGCRFNTRCPEMIGKICRSKEPELIEVETNHFVRCHLYVQ